MAKREKRWFQLYGLASYGLHARDLEGGGGGGLHARLCVSGSFDSGLLEAGFLPEVDRGARARARLREDREVQRSCHSCTGSPTDLQIYRTKLEVSGECFEQNNPVRFAREGVRWGYEHSGSSAHGRDPAAGAGLGRGRGWL